MKKKFLLTLFISVISMSSFAQTEVMIDGINYILDPSDNTAIVGKNPNAEGAIIIPEIIQYEGNDYTVDEVGDYAFLGNLVEGSKWKREHCKITSITLPESIKIIGVKAFMNCDALFSISLPNSVKKIGDCAFWYSGLTRIVIGNKVTKIGDRAFANTNLKKVVIPNSVTLLGDNIFSECKKLTEVKIGNGVKTMPMFAFDKCEELEIVEFGVNTQKISAGVFNECTTISEINLPENLKEIEFGAIMKCPMLVTLRIPAGVKELKDGIVTNCENFEQLIVTSMDTQFKPVAGKQYVVRDCPNFKGIYLDYGGTSMVRFPEQ